MVSRFFGPAKRSFDDLSEQEVLALAISSEEDDARIYLAYADGLREQYPQSAKVFEEMADEEHDHRNRLIALHQKRFGETIPLIRRDHVRGYFRRSIFACLLGMPARSARASICFCTSGVSTHPGQIALHVMPVRAVSSATDLVRPMMPCLAAT